MLRKETILPELLMMIQKVQSDDLFKNHILVGGTALALQLGHRVSRDMDFFSLETQNNIDIIHYFREHYNNVEILNNGKNIVQLRVDGIKADILSVKGKLLEKPERDEGVIFARTKDIAGMKLMAISGRKEAKDYIDICYLLQEMTLKEMFQIFREKSGQQNILDVKKALMESTKVNPYEWERVEMIRKDIFISDVPRIIREEVIQYNKEMGIRPGTGVFRRIFKKDGGYEY